MTWKSEAKQVTQQYYGGYCNMCKQLNIIPVAYCIFTIEIHNEIKTLIRSLPS